MQEVKKLGVLSVAKISGLLGVLLGLVMAIIFAIATRYVPSGSISEIPLGNYGWASIIILPIFYGIIYFISGLICAAVYNVLAGRVGGIMVDLSKEGKK